MLPWYAIITAAGAGVRMNTPLPKQFIPLLGKPVLMHTIEAFLKVQFNMQIILVLPRDQMDYWAQLCRDHAFNHPVQLAEGGPTRFHSVKNGLRLVPDNHLVAIHDGVRPLVSAQTITEAFHLAEKFGNAIPVVKISESVRIIEHAFNRPIDRQALRIVQTPQCFRSSLIKQAYNVNFHETFTDDASVLEKTGERIYLSEGNKENIKITTPEDLLIAEAIMNKEVNK
jgi:2-C-methyl-D-erythritol 4-phosphate cytidylyltransferase